MILRHYTGWSAGRRRRMPLRLAERFDPEASWGQEFRMSPHPGFEFGLQRHISDMVLETMYRGMRFHRILISCATPRPISCVLVLVSAKASINC